MLNLNDLLKWLEYGHTSGYDAARQSAAQEHNWAKQLRALMAKNEELRGLLSEVSDTYHNYDLTTDDLVESLDGLVKRLDAAIKEKT